MLSLYFWMPPLLFTLTFLFTLNFQSSEKLSVPWTSGFKSINKLIVLGIGRSMSSLIRRRSSKKPLLFAPASISRFASSSSPLFPRPSLWILVEPSWVFRPFNIESESAKIHVLKCLLSLFSTALALILNEGISFLIGNILTLRSILQLP